MDLMRSTALVAVLLTGVVIASASAPPETARAGDPCVRAGDKRLAHGARVVVVYRADRDATIACDRRTRRRVRLDDGDADVGIMQRRIWVGGPFVLYQEEGSDGLTIYTALMLRDVRARRRGVGLAGTDGGTSKAGFVRDGVVDADGNVAAILASSGEPARVVVCPYRGCGDADLPSPQVVDSGPIKPNSLVRRGQYVYWRSGGKLRRAPLLP